MISFDVSEICSLELSQRQGESFALVPPDSFRIFYEQYRYFYVCLLQGLCSEKTPEKGLKTQLRALDRILTTENINTCWLVKSELSLYSSPSKEGKILHFLDALKVNYAAFLNSHILVTEISLIRAEYDRFLLMMFTRERKTDWQKEFYIPLFVLYHIYFREKEKIKGIDLEPFPHGSDIQMALYNGAEISSKNHFPILQSIRMSTQYIAFWTQKLDLLPQLAARDMNIPILPIITDSIRSPDVHIPKDSVYHLIDKHKNLTTGIGTLILSMIQPCKIKLQKDFLPSFMGKKQTDIPPLAEFNSYDSLWAKWKRRRETQLQFYLRCRSVEEMSYRGKIIRSELDRVEIKNPRVTFSTHCGDQLRSRALHKPALVGTSEREIHPSKLFSQHSSLEKHSNPHVSKFSDAEYHRGTLSVDLIQVRAALTALVMYI